MQHMSVSFVSLRSTRVHLQNNIFILGKVMENHCDMAYQKSAKSSFRKKFVYITWPCPFKLYFRSHEISWLFGNRWVEFPLIQLSDIMYMLKEIPGESVNTKGIFACHLGTFFKVPQRDSFQKIAYRIWTEWPISARQISKNSRTC